MADKRESTGPAVSVRMLAPAPDLRPLIDAYYIVETFGPVQDRYLAGPGNIRFRTKGNWVLTIDGVVYPTAERAALFGPTDRTGMFGPTDAGIMLGAGLTPVGWATLLDIPAGDMAGKVCELGDVIGNDAAEEIADAIDRARSDGEIKQALDDWITRRAAARPPAEPRIAAVQEALLAVPNTVTAFAAAAGVSLRTLNRITHRAFGFAPKALLRQKRFQRTLERVRGRLDQPLSDIIDDDYFDQAHFNRDFRQYMGMSPTEYYSTPRPIMRPSADVRRSLNGAGLQGLHPGPFE